MTEWIISETQYVLVVVWILVSFFDFSGMFSSIYILAR